VLNGTILDMLMRRYSWFDELKSDRPNARWASLIETAHSAR
jgi:hypothetical protein